MDYFESMAAANPAVFDEGWVRRKQMQAAEQAAKVAEARALAAQNPQVFDAGWLGNREARAISAGAPVTMTRQPARDQNAWLQQVLQNWQRVGRLAPNGMPIGSQSVPASLSGKPTIGPYRGLMY